MKPPATKSPKKMAQYSPEWNEWNRRKVTAMLDAAIAGGTHSTPSQTACALCGQKCGGFYKTAGGAPVCAACQALAK